MKNIEITDDLFVKYDMLAKREARQLGNLKGSIENGDGNYAGFFAEALFADQIGGERDNTYEYDIIYNDNKIDIKTKRRSVTPEPYYECSVADYNTEQDCDYYYFVSVRYDYSEASLLGYLTPEEYYDKATFHEAGDIDEDNGFEFKADCWNVPISGLETEIENE